MSLPIDVDPDGTGGWTVAGSSNTITFAQESFRCQHRRASRLLAARRQRPCTLAGFPDDEDLLARLALDLLANEGLIPFTMGPAPRALHDNLGHGKFLVSPHREPPDPCPGGVSPLLPYILIESAVNFS
jgi:hypothetical protein